MKKNRENSEKGQALLLVLVLLLVGVLIITSSLNFLGTTRKTNEVYIANTTSLYAADAGINDAEWQLENATSDVPTSSANDVTYPLTMINGYTPSVTIHM
jgi:Tfp pilus assembly protein PilX